MAKTYTEIYPDKFFSIPTPTTPWFSVQFRTKVLEQGGDIEQADIWSELTINQNTFVKQIEIEDNGGSKKLTLTLFDRDFSTIENLVMGSLFVTRVSNEIINEDIKQYKVDDFTFNYVLTSNSIVNLRVRIGYSDLNNFTYNGNQRNFFEAESSTSDFEQRIDSTQPVIRSPWYYFMISGITNEITENGLQMTITGLSLTSNALTNLKMVQTFSKLVATPEDMINKFREIFNNIPNSGIKISEFGSGSDKPLVESKNEQIEILLGGEPVVDSNKHIIISYKTIGEIFSDICSKIRPKIIGNSIDVKTDDETADESQQKVFYNYFVTSDGTVNFFYPNPNESRQNLKRIYTWREYPQNLIRSFNIQTATDFAIMSQKLLVKNVDSTLNEIDLIPKKTETKDDILKGPTNLGITKTFEGYNAALRKDFSFVSDVVDVKTSSEPGVEDVYKNQLKTAFLKNINTQVFKGSISIAGDPFFFFDNAVRPFEYLIKINVLRPTDSIAEKSYFSGDYAVTNIKHTLSETDFETVLDVMRWPNQDEMYEVQK